MPDTPLGFRIIGGTFIRDQFAVSHLAVIDLVREAYLEHEQGRTVNPSSHFLRFPDKPEARIIALPAALRADSPQARVSGIKWIASYPRNVESGLQRASAVVVLNDYETGYPFACLEASLISAARTAASAALAARELRGGDRHARTLGFVGAGPIASTILQYLLADGWRVDEVVVHDLVRAHAESFASSHPPGTPAPRAVDAREALDADVVVLATTAPAPWIPTTHRFRPGQLVLNISLRDLPPESILASNNVFDDVDHCMTANTSPHLTEQRCGHRDFVTGTLAQLMTGARQLDHSRPVIFSPFGLGILDLKLAAFLYERGIDAGAAIDIPGFFADMRRRTA